MREHPKRVLLFGTPSISKKLEIEKIPEFFIFLFYIKKLSMVKNTQFREGGMVKYYSTPTKKVIFNMDGEI